MWGWECYRCARFINCHLLAVRFFQKQVQVGVVPLGTGNDLARVLGWGSVCDVDAHLAVLLERYERATTKMLDRSVGPEQRCALKFRAKLINSVHLASWCFFFSCNSFNFLFIFNSSYSKSIFFKYWIQVIQFISFQLFKFSQVQFILGI